MSDTSDTLDFFPCIRVAIALCAAHETDRAEAQLKGWPFPTGKAGRRGWYLGYMRGLVAGMREGVRRETPVTELPSAIFTALLQRQRAARQRALAEIRTPEYQARRAEAREEVATMKAARFIRDFGRACSPRARDTPPDRRIPIVIPPESYIDSPDYGDTAEPAHV